MRWLLLLSFLGCGGKVDDSCQSKPAEIGDCFSNVTIIKPTACGLPPTPDFRFKGLACTERCPASTNFCAWDGKTTLRCEQCAK